MKISPLDLEHAVPGNSLVVERYFLQGERVGRDGAYWADMRLDANIDGLRTPEMAQDTLVRTKGSYGDFIAWRIIKRICTITAEVVS